MGQGETCFGHDKYVDTQLATPAILEPPIDSEAMGIDGGLDAAATSS